MADPAVVLMVHGGADPLPREQMTPERERGYHEALAQALRAGHAALRSPGGTALDGVEAADRVIGRDLKEAGGEGGTIVLGPGGDFAMPFHSKGMYRGTITEDGTARVAIDEGPAEVV